MPLQASEIAQVPVSEAEENRDPNPEPSVCSDQLAIAMGDSKTSPKIVKEEPPLPIIVADEIIDGELNNVKIAAEPEEEEMVEEEEDQDHEDENNR